ncbi:MAG: endopeptidase La [Candidatus Sumerlaeia bacterium]|nr:endopeptidase La [Candidatus Sumerlaeia bacterium]
MYSEPDNVSQGANLPPSGNGMPEDIPTETAILPMEGIVVFPMMVAPIVISDDGAKKLVEEIMKGDRTLSIFHPIPDSTIEFDGLPVEVIPEEPPKKSDDGTDNLFPVGTLCTVLRMLRIPDGTIRLLVHGVARVKIGEVVPGKGCLKAKVTPIEEKDDYKNDIELDATAKLVMDTLNKAIGMGALSDELAVAAMNVDGPGRLADLVASNLPVSPFDLLGVLEEADVKTRLHQVQRMLGREVLMLEIGHRINDEVREEVDKGQRSYYLHQQMRAIRKELGEADPHEAEMEEMTARIEDGTMPEHARAIARRELKRLEALPPAAAEYGVIRTYIEWILDIPWGKTSDDHIDIAAARKVLDEDHYGLEKVKERILEFLSVIRLKKGNLKGPILCLVGPPGVGKTSLGRSVARATGRNFQSFSLGGMRDEAEIRGHRRTYVGAMPGRIIKSLKDAGTMNPLVMLDEIDKLGTDFRGDPGSALLEVLDPEQNNHFTDHYMDMPMDLSKVMFITTANSLDTIPPALRDRMEIIRLAGYTELEKQEIAHRYLVPREMRNSGLTRNNLLIAKPVLRKIVREYTSESGVRNLQREIGKICRKVAMRVAEHDSDRERVAKGKKGASKKKTTKKSAPLAKIKVAADNLEEFLGTRRTFSEVAERLGRPGVSVGLAWTNFGGEILFIEAARYPGKGQLQLTGQLGDVMKESAQAALTYLKSNYERLDMAAEDFEKWDYHVHVPAGATPKDGPSAGVAMVTSLASLITGRQVKNFVAMSGEITLRGNVMPVGGIKEKCLAAHRSGIREVFLPHHNEGEFKEVPEVIRKGLKVSFFREVTEYLARAISK